MVYPALLPLMRTPRLPVVDWTDAPANLNGLVLFAERPNLVPAHVSSRFKRAVMLDTPCFEVVWRVLANHSIHQFPLHFSSCASPCAITFQLKSTYCDHCITDRILTQPVLLHKTANFTVLATVLYEPDTLMSNHQEWSKNWGLKDKHLSTQLQLKCGQPVSWSARYCLDRQYKFRPTNDGCMKMDKPLLVDANTSRTVALLGNVMSFN